METKFAHYLSAAEASSQNIAQEKDKIKSLIADISHQTKTPIANLLLYSELLMEETLPASAKTNVEALYKQSEKLRFLIDSLVKLSRLENGIISLAPQQAALQPLLESVVEQYAAKVSEKRIVFATARYRCFCCIRLQMDSGSAGEYRRQCHQIYGAWHHYYFCRKL